MILAGHPDVTFYETPQASEMPQVTTAARDSRRDRIKGVSNQSTSTQYPLYIFSAHKTSRDKVYAYKNTLVTSVHATVRDIVVDLLSPHFRIMGSFVFRLQVGTVTNRADVQSTITSVNIYQLTPRTNCYGCAQDTPECGVSTLR